MPEVIPPAQVAGLPVVASVRVPGDPPTATSVFVVITRNAFVPDERAYVVWTCWIRADGLPVVGDCRAYLGWDGALDVLISRARHLG